MQAVGKSNQLIEFECYSEKEKLSFSCDPTIFVKSPDTGEYEPWRIRNYEHKDPSSFFREGASKWEQVKIGTLELPFPNGKDIHIENVSAVIITWGKIILRGIGSIDDFTPRGVWYCTRSGRNGKVGSVGSSVNRPGNV